MILSRFIIVLSIALVAFAAFIGSSKQQISFTEDIALTYAVVETISSGNPVLLGPPSHVGGRHLGGVYYYLVYFTYLLSNYNLHFSFLITIFFHLTGVLFVIKSIELLLAKKTSALIYLSVSLCCLTPSYLQIIRTPWHGNSLFPATSLFIFLIIRWLDKNEMSLGKFLLTASLLIQLHYSASVLVFSVGILLLIYARKQLFSFQINKSEMLYYLALILIWVPLLIYQFFYSNNLLELFNGMSARTGKELGFASSYYLLKDFYWKFLPINNLRSLWLNLFLVSSFSLFITQVKNLKIQRFLVLTLISSIIYYLVMAKMKTPVKIYFIYGLLPFPLLISSLLIASLSDYWNSAWKKIVVLTVIYSLIISIGINLNKIFILNKTNSVTIGHSLNDLEIISKKMKRKKENSIAIYTDSASTYIEASLYYLLGNNSYHQIKYWDTLTELPQKEINKFPKNIYLVACPEIYSKQINMWEERFAKLGYKLKKRIRLNKRLSRCLMAKYAISE